MQSSAVHNMLLLLASLLTPTPHSLVSQVQVQVFHSPWLVKTFKIAQTQLVFIDQTLRLISITYSNAFTV